MLNEIKKYNPRACCLAISICLGTGDLTKRSFGYNKNVYKYNAILKVIFGENYIEINNLVPEGELLIEDNIHLTKHAHKQLAGELVRRCVLIEGLS